VSKSNELAAACALYPNAYERLNIPEPEFRGNVLSREQLRDRFTFTAAELRQYIETNPGLAEDLYDKSLSQRSTPSAFMVEAPGGYSVGWYDDARSEEHFHERIEDAAADFVLAYWGLPRP
jgi:hypothetical protein